jgi:hypothetical protein
MRVIACLAATSILLIGALTGCAADPKTALVGSYKADVNTLVVPAAAKPMEKMLKDVVGKMELKLSADDSFTFGGGPGQSLTGKWKFDEKSVTLTPDKNQAGAKEVKLNLSTDKKTLTLEQENPAGKMSLGLVKTS